MTRYAIAILLALTMRASAQDTANQILPPLSWSAPEPDSAVTVTRFSCAIHCSDQSETMACAYQQLSCACRPQTLVSSRTAAGPGTPGVPLTPFSSALRRSSKALLASAPTYTSTTLANSAASAAVRSPAATAAAMLAIASTLSTAFSSGGSSTATGWCLIGGTSRSMHTRMAAISALFGECDHLARDPLGTFRQ